MGDAGVLDVGRIDAIGIERVDARCLALDVRCSVLGAWAVAVALAPSSTPAGTSGQCTGYGCHQRSQCDLPVTLGVDAMLGDMSATAGPVSMIANGFRTGHASPLDTHCDGCVRRGSYR